MPQLEFAMEEFMVSGFEISQSIKIFDVIALQMDMLASDVFMLSLPTANLFVLPYPKQVL